MKVKLTVAIEGMHCQSCVNRVSHVLKKIDGVDVLDVKVGAAILACSSDRKKALIVEAITNTGFQVVACQ